MTPAFSCGVSRTHPSHIVYPEPVRLHNVFRTRPSPMMYLEHVLVLWCNPFFYYGVSRTLSFPMVYQESGFFSFSVSRTRPSPCEYLEPFLLLMCNKNPGCSPWCIYKSSFSHNVSKTCSSPWRISFSYGLSKKPSFSYGLSRNCPSPYEYLNPVLFLLFN